MALIKQQESAEQIEALFGEALAEPSPRVRCADCGWLEETNAMWFVPIGKHRLFGTTRAICQECRNVRLEEQQAARSGAISAPAPRPRSESAEEVSRENH